jgi:hypothetical protein
MSPQLAAFFLRGVCARLDRLQSTLHLLHKNLETKRVKDVDLLPRSALADLCSDEVGDIYGSQLLQVIKGLEANCEPDAAPEGGNPAA